METIEAIKCAEDKVLDVYEWAENRYCRRLDLPQLRFDLRGLTAGLAYPVRNLIRLNLDLLRANPEDFIEETVPHEAAHLLTWAINGLKAKPHGAEWKGIMRDMGREPVVCHTYAASRVRGRIRKVFYYACDCAGDNHTFTVIRHKRAAAGMRYRCATCKVAVRYVGVGVQLLF